MPLETNCCSQNSRTRTAYWSGGISLGMVSTHRLASWEFHCFSTASAAFHKGIAVCIFLWGICREQDFIVDDTTLFRVVLHLLVVFTEQLFAALVSSGGNRRLPLAALNNRDFVVWTGHFVSLLSVIGGWGGKRFIAVNVKHLNCVAVIYFKLCYLLLIHRNKCSLIISFYSVLGNSSLNPRKFSTPTEKKYPKERPGRLT